MSRSHSEHGGRISLRTPHQVMNKAGTGQIIGDFFSGQKGIRQTQVRWNSMDAGGPLCM